MNPTAAHFTAVDDWIFAVVKETIEADKEVLQLLWLVRALPDGKIEPHTALAVGEFFQNGRTKDALAMFIDKLVTAPPELGVDLVVMISEAWTLKTTTEGRDKAPRDLSTAPGRQEAVLVVIRSRDGEQQTISYRVERNPSRLKREKPYDQISGRFAGPTRQ